MQSFVRQAVIAPLVAITLGATACLPYTVGSTARPVPPHVLRRSTTAYVIPNATDRMDGDSLTTPLFGLDYEARFGLDARSDIGIRAPNASGAVVTYKRLLTPNDTTRTLVAWQAGAGFVNWGEHAHFELTLLTSGPEARMVVPYGGLRLMQVAPLTRDAPHDLPTAGGFFGVRIGDAEMSISPEVGVFYDHSTLGVRRGDLLVVPAVTLNGEGLGRVFGGWPFLRRY